MNTKDFFDEFDNAPDDIVENIDKICAPLSECEEKRIYSIMEKKYNSRKIPDSFEYSVSGVDMYKRPPLYRRVLTAAASLLLISGVAYSFYTLGRMNNIPTQHAANETNTTIISTQAPVTESTTVRLPFTYTPPWAIESGELSITIQKAEIFDSIEDAGIDPNEINTYSLYDYETKTSQSEWKILKLHIFAENKNAVTSFKNMGERYPNDEYEFEVGANTVLKYKSLYSEAFRDYQMMWFSLKGECKSNSYKFLCMPETTREYDIAYYVKSKDDVYIMTANGKNYKLIIE
ncbi:MAG: hypothetical protein E7495_06925 [Ruminococcus flavefaciens]|nr:hypothetical protein [Ruminococcus flavefaciens]